MNDNALIADIEGYASIFNARDLNGDIIATGAFAKSLRAGPAIRMLYQHAAETPIGRWTSVREDARGLYVKGEILLSSSQAREVHALLSGGALDGLSIGYQTVRAKKTAAGGRRILEASLWEVSIVTFPMAAGARVAYVGAPRSEQATDSARVSSSARAAREGAQSMTRLPSQSGRARRRADEESAAFAAGRALASPPAGARQFAEILRDAAEVFLV